MVIKIANVLENYQILLLKKNLYKEEYKIDFSEQISEGGKTLSLILVFFY